MMTSLPPMKCKLLALVFIATGFIPVSSLCTHGRRAHRNCGLLPRDDKCGVAKVHQRVVGGHDALLGQFPWIAILYLQSQVSESPESIALLCGGSLVNDRYVVTAAHCILGGTEKYLRVRLGEHKLSTTEDCLPTQERECAPHVQDFQLENIVIHPKYNNQTLQYDLALMRLEQKVNFNRYVHPICLPIDRSFRRESTLRRKELDVAGWGISKQEDGVDTHPDILQTVSLPFVPKRRCERAYGRRLDDSKLCAGGQLGKDSCSGDSGGPLMGRFSPRRSRDRYFLIGVVSFGDPLCGNLTVPGVYANVPELIEWVLDNISQ